MRAMQFKHPVAQRNAVAPGSASRRALVVRASEEPRQQAPALWTPSFSTNGEPVIASAAGPIQLNKDGQPAPTRRGMLQSLVMGGAIAACPCCIGIGEAQASGGAKFDYGTLSGPISWGGTCSSGQRQSPINIPAKAIRASNGARSTTAACKPAQIDPRGYKAVKPMILNTGVGTMQVRRRCCRRRACAARGARRAAGGSRRRRRLRGAAGRQRNGRARGSAAPHPPGAGHPARTHGRPASRSPSFRRRAARPAPAPRPRAL